MFDNKLFRVVRFTSRRLVRGTRARKRRIVRALRRRRRFLRPLLVVAEFVKAVAWVVTRRGEPALTHGAFRRPMRVLMYSPSSLNTIDGSSVWLQSTAHVLHEDSRIGIVIPLRAADNRGVFTDALRKLDYVALIDSSRFRLGAKDLSVRRAIRMMRWLDARVHFDVLLIRKYEVCLAASRERAFAGRYWSAFIYEPERDPSDAEYVEGMRSIARASRHVIVQSERIRRQLEQLVPEAAGKVLIVPPAIPSRSQTAMPPVTRRLLYTGKLVPHYRFEELIGVYASLRREYPDLEFHIAGDKIPSQPNDPDYRRRLLRLLSSTPGLVWYGGIAREDVMELLAGGGVGLNVWDPAYAEGLNDLVVPSKTLEYCAAGIPVVVQRTTAHEDMLGASYPFLVDGGHSVEDCVRALLKNEDAYRAAAETARASAEAFSYESIYAGLKGALGSAAPDDAAARSPRASRASR